MSVTYIASLGIYVKEQYELRPLQSLAKSLPNSDVF